MDLGEVLKWVTPVGVIFAIFNSFWSVQKTRKDISEKAEKAAREAGAKEEKDKYRDKRIDEAFAKITEVDDVKQEILKMTFRFEALEIDIKRLIIGLEKHIERER